MYAILDEQSNRPLVTSAFFSIFNVACSPSPYTLRTCSGLKETAGRKARGYVVESADEKASSLFPHSSNATKSQTTVQRSQPPMLLDTTDT